MKSAFYAVAIALFIGLMAPSTFAFDWQTDIDKAFSDAKTEHKPVLVYCYHPRTIKEDKAVWLHPLVQKFSNDFIAVNLNIDQPGDFLAEHRVKSYPAVLFFDEFGDELISFRYEEQLKRTVLALRFRQALDAIDEFELVKAIVKDGNTKDPRMIYQYAKGMRDRGHFDEAEEYFNRLLHQKALEENLILQIKNAYINMFFLQASRAFYDGDYAVSIDTLNRYLNRYPGEEGVHKANFLLGLSFYESGAKKEGEAVLKKLAKDSSAGILQQKAQRYLDEKKG